MMQLIGEFGRDHKQHRLDSSFAQCHRDTPQGNSSADLAHVSCDMISVCTSRLLCATHIREYNRHVSTPIKVQQARTPTNRGCAAGTHITFHLSRVATNSMR